MIVYPETMRRAQAEIDDLLGDEDVIPSAEQMDNLPYCVALTREVCILSLNPFPYSFNLTIFGSGDEMDASYPWLIFSLL